MFINDDGERFTRMRIGKYLPFIPILLRLALSIPTMGAKMPIWASKEGTTALFAYLSTPIA
jgi:hypothetical protein